VKLRLKCLKPKFFREVPPERATQVELLIQIFFKDERSSCQNMLQELNLLKNFQSGLQNHGIQWREKLPNEDLNIIEELQELLIEVKNQGPRPSGKNVKTQKRPETLEDDIETLTITEREDVDLTDKLWNVLKKVDSFAQLVEAWKFVFSTFKREEIKPYISSRNFTKVAKIIQSIVRGQEFSETSTLQGSMPLELLYEIGVEKLQRDYFYPILSNLLARRYGRNNG